MSDAVIIGLVVIGCLVVIAGIMIIAEKTFNRMD